MAEPVLCSLSSLLGWWILLSTEFNSAHHIVRAVALLGARVGASYPDASVFCCWCRVSHLLLSRSTRSETEDSAPRGPSADQSSRAEGGREGGRPV